MRNPASGMGHFFFFVGRGGGGGGEGKKSVVLHMLSLMCSIARDPAVILNCHISEVW